MKYIAHGLAVSEIVYMSQKALAWMGCVGVVTSAEKAIVQLGRTLARLELI